MARIRKGDLVVVRAGAEKGKRGKVLSVLPGEGGGKAIVEGVNLVFKHLKKSQKHPQGGRIRREAPVWQSKLMPVDPSTDEGTRVSFRVVDGKKVRVARGSGTSLEGEVKARGGRKPAAQGEESSS